MKKKKNSRELIPQAEKQAAFLWLRGFIRPEIDKFLMVFFLMISMTAFILLQPYFGLKIIDDGLLARHWDSVTTFMVLLFFSVFAAFILKGIIRWVFVSLCGRILLNLKEDLYDHLLKLSPDFYQRRSQKDILARLDGDMMMLQQFFSTGFLAFIQNSLLLIFGILVLMWISVKLAFLAIFFLAFLAFFTHISRKRLARGTAKLKKNAAEATQVMAQSLEQVKRIQTMLGEGYEKRKLHQKNRNFYERYLDVQIVDYLVQFGPAFLICCAVIIFLMTGASDVMRSEISLGSLLAFLVYVVLMAGSVRHIAVLYDDFPKMQHHLHAVWALRAEPLLVRQSPACMELGERARGEIVMDNICIEDPSASLPAKLYLNLHIYPGEKILITGPGTREKSLIGDLFHRHFDPSSGEFRLDGVDIKQLSFRALRRHIAVIGSEIPPFHGPLADHIRYGLEKITMDQVAIAGRAAQVDDFADALERGYDTLVGNGDLILNESQKQRITMARALLMDPHVLILDDRPTRDDIVGNAASKASFFELVDHYFEDRTRIIINYDAEAEYEVDRVFVLKGDHLEEMNGRQNRADI